MEDIISFSVLESKLFSVLTFIVNDEKIYSYLLHDVLLSYHSEMSLMKH